MGGVDAERAVEAVYRARGEWVADFGGEQFTLGRAFYTHLETGRAREYFADRAASDARVERWLPGLQERARRLFAELAGGVARARLGYCGPGVHVFPAGEVVARRGGIIHYDVEGLSPHHLAERSAALSFVLMLQPATWGGGLRVWDVSYHGTEAVSDEEEAAPHALVRYGVGDALLMSSYTMHQIRPFRGDRDRISVTLHAVQVDAGVWETWF
ncbi:MAG: hypothetical protein U0271_26955 [Polyangiaceae bacterium]